MRVQQQAVGDRDLAGVGVDRESAASVVRQLERDRSAVDVVAVGINADRRTVHGPFGDGVRSRVSIHRRAGWYVSDRDCHGRRGRGSGIVCHLHGQRERGIRLEVQAARVIDGQLTGRRTDGERVARVAAGDGECHGRVCIARSDCSDSGTIAAGFADGKSLTVDDRQAIDDQSHIVEISVPAVVVVDDVELRCANRQQRALRQTVERPGDRVGPIVVDDDQCVSRRRRVAQGGQQVNVRGDRHGSGDVELVVSARIRAGGRAIQFDVENRT